MDTELTESPRGICFRLSVPDVLQSIALRKAAQEGTLDALRVPESPLDVLAQALLGMSIEKPWRCMTPINWCSRPALIKIFRSMILKRLSNIWRVAAACWGRPGAYGKIILEGDNYSVSRHGRLPAITT